MIYHIEVEVPDISSFDASKIETENLIELTASLESTIRTANSEFNEAMRPLYGVIAESKAILLKSFPEGAVEIPHNTFIVRKEQKTERLKSVADFEALKPLLPDSEYQSMVYAKSIKGALDSHLISLAKDTPGVVVEESVDLRVADKLARKYKGEVQSIVEKASPRVNIDQPYLSIQARTQAAEKAGV